MSDKDLDPTASTAQFKAFADNADVDQARSKTGLVVTLVVLAVLVAAAVIAYLMLGA